MKRESLGTMQDAIETKQRADLFPGRPINDKRINRLLPSALPLAVWVSANAVSLEGTASTN